MYETKLTDAVGNPLVLFNLLYFLSRYISLKFLLISSNMFLRNKAVYIRDYHLSRCNYLLFLLTNQIDTNHLLHHYSV